MPDPRLDNLMLDLKQQAALTTETTSNVQQQKAEAEALLEVFNGLNEKATKFLMTEGEIDIKAKDLKKQIEASSEILSKIPTVAKTLETIQKSTGKSYGDALKILQKTFELQGKMTKETKAVKEATDSLEKIYKKNLDDIEKSGKALKDVGKTEKEIAREREKEDRRRLQMTKEIMGHMKTMLGGAGAGGPGALIKGLAGLGGMATRRQFPKGTAISLGLADVIVDALMYQFQLGLRTSILGTRLEALAGNRRAFRPGKAGEMRVTTSPYLSIEEHEKYAPMMYGRGIIPRVGQERKELEEFAANSKRYGDEINMNITERMIQSTGTVEKSWEHINIIFNTFRETAKKAGVPLQDIAKWTAEISSQARFLGVDYKVVSQVMTGIVKNQKELFRMGITREKFGGIAADLLTTRAKHTMPVSAFWAQQIGLKGPVSRQIEEYQMGGYFREKPGGGYNFIQTNNANQIALKTLQAFQRMILSGPQGYEKGMIMMQSGLAPIKRPESLRTLMTTPATELFKKLPELTQDNKSSKDFLGKLVTYETYKQKFMQAITGILLEILKALYNRRMANLDPFLKQIKGITGAAFTIDEGGPDFAGFGTDIGGPRSSMRGIGLWGMPKPTIKKKGQKHIGGTISKGDIAEVLTDESFRSLGKDSFYAFNPIQDIQIGSPQTTKNQIQKQINQGGSSRSQNITYTINMNGASILTDNLFFKKLQEVIATSRNP